MQLLFPFESDKNSTRIVSPIISRNLLDKILFIPSFDISNISTTVLSIFCINASVIILLFFKKYLSKISLKFSITL